jgi:hypothetical protein
LIIAEGRTYKGLHIMKKEFWIMITLVICAVIAVPPFISAKSDWMVIAGFGMIFGTAAYVADFIRNTKFFKELVDKYFTKE